MDYSRINVRNEMRKIYQTEWHGIPFKSFSILSSVQLAGPTFYKSFYKDFFKRYNQLEDLDPNWVQLKLQTMVLVKERIRCGKEGHILSIGCGLGIIEKALIDDGFCNLEINEVSRESLRWVQPHISSKKVHIGFFPGCLPRDNVYDFILLASVEYFLDKSQLISFLKNVKSRLSPKGSCLLISWSFESAYRIKSVVNSLKDLKRNILEKLKINHRGQFWGYSRNPKEFHDAMDSAGFTRIIDGLLEKKTQWDTYWIEGSKK